MVHGVDEVDPGNAGVGVALGYRLQHADDVALACLQCSLVCRVLRSTNKQSSGRHLVGGKLALWGGEGSAEVGQGAELLLGHRALKRLDRCGHFGGDVGNRAAKDLREVEQADELVDVILLKARLTRRCLRAGVLGLDSRFGCLGSLGSLDGLLLRCCKLLVQGGLDGDRQALKFISNDQKRWLCAKRFLLRGVECVQGGVNATVT